jgi:hypothetical protein
MAATWEASVTLVYTNKDKFQEYVMHRLDRLSATSDLKLHIIKMNNFINEIRAAPNDLFVEDSDLPDDELNNDHNSNKNSNNTISEEIGQAEKQSIIQMLQSAHVHLKRADKEIDRAINPSGCKCIIS